MFLISLEIFLIQYRLFFEGCRLLKKMMPISLEGKAYIIYMDFRLLYSFPIYPQLLH